MNGQWGTATYGPGTTGEAVPLVDERCTSRPWDSNRGRHTCRSHRTHSGNHRCICGMQWNYAGKVQP